LLSGELLGPPAPIVVGVACSDRLGFLPYALGLGLPIHESDAPPAQGKPPHDAAPSSGKLSSCHPPEVMSRLRTKA
jgi:hypothetical protein